MAKQRKVTRILSKGPYGKMHAYWPFQIMYHKKKISSTDLQISFIFEYWFYNFIVHLKPNARKDLGFHTLFHAINVHSTSSIIGPPNIS